LPRNAAINVLDLGFIYAGSLIFCRPPLEQHAILNADGKAVSHSAWFMTHVALLSPASLVHWL
jgi:hypothetical protein